MMTKMKGRPRRKRGRGPVKAGRKSSRQDRARTVVDHKNTPLSRFKSCVHG